MPIILKKILVFSISTWINLLHRRSPSKAVQLIYKFFSEPRKGNLKKQKIPAVLVNAEVKMIEWTTHIFPVYHWNNNQSESVMLVHGWESNAARWEPFLSILKTKYNVFALDAPAHGLASGKEFNAVLYAQFIQKAQEVFPTHYLIGHSVGGMASFYYAYQNPTTHVQKMVLLGAPATLQKLVMNYANLLKLNPVLLKDFEAFFVEKFNFKFHEFSLENFAPQVKIEGMIAHDLDDDVVLFEEAEKINRTWQNAFLHPTKGLGHSMQDEKLYFEVMNFLQK